MVTAGLLGKVPKSPLTRAITIPFKYSTGVFKYSTGVFRCYLDVFTCSIGFFTCSIGFFTCPRCPRALSKCSWPRIERMDTRFWGPSGWKLLHLVCETDTASLYPFLETIPHILPCHFCRASLTEYYQQHPYTAAPNMSRWIYQIHNLVNAKLRKQGLHPAPNPSYASAKARLADLAASPWSAQLTSFWDFFFAVGYHHPRHTKAVSRWFRRFWSVLPDVLPAEIQQHWVAALRVCPPDLTTRRSTMAWLWRMRCHIDTEFHDPYLSVCQRVGSFSSDCGTRRGAITCRRRRMRTAKNHAGK